MDIKKIFIVGAGLMGSGIAQACAQVGLKAEVLDVDSQAVQKSSNAIAWSVGKLAEKGKLKEDVKTILARIRYVDDFAAAAAADLAIEAVVENLEVKRNVFRDLDRFCSPDALLASNTSAIPITELAAATKRPESVIGLHFFNPVAMMQAVEVVRGVGASEAAMQGGVDFVAALQKKAIRVEMDMPGFLLNRINLVSYVEAIRLLEQGVGSVADIDQGVKLAFGRKMGPFETGDMVGLDVSCGALTAIYNDSRDMRFFPPQLLRRKVKAGQLGRKTGRGWYVYDGAGNPVGSAA